MHLGNELEHFDFEMILTGGQIGFQPEDELPPPSMEGDSDAPFATAGRGEDAAERCVATHAPTRRTRHDDLTLTSPAAESIDHAKGIYPVVE